MKVYLNKEPKILSFGLADCSQEITDVFRIRFEEYSRRGYINTSFFPNRLEKDEYDENPNTVYFITKIDDRVIGCIRLIKDDILPTEKFFVFAEPELMRNIPKGRRAELSRFIIVPPDRDKKIFLPRNLIMLFMIKTLVKYGVENGLDGGYVFLKSSLSKKFAKIMLPIHRIEVFKLLYPETGFMYPYFHQEDDPVAPFFYVTSEVKNYITRITDRTLIFRKFDDQDFVLKNNLYTRFLKAVNVI